MTELHKRPYRHPHYKIAYRVDNWREYEQSLRHRGTQPLYSDIAIVTALTLRLRFRLPLRRTEGFFGSVLTMLDLSLPCPDHTTLSRRHATVLIW